MNLSTILSNLLVFFFRVGSCTISLNKDTDLIEYRSIHNMYLHICYVHSDPNSIFLLHLFDPFLLILINPK